MASPFPSPYMDDKNNARYSFSSPPNPPVTDKSINYNANNQSNGYNFYPGPPGANQNAYTPVTTAPTLPYSNNPAPHRPAITSLWKEQALATAVGIVALTLGALGLAAVFEQGPLYAIFITPAEFTGHIINARNTTALSSGIITAIGAIARSVCAGVARASLRRKVLRGDPITVKQWRTLAAGVSIHDVRRTPFIAGGMILAFTVAIASMNSAFNGVAVPTARNRYVTSTYGPIVPYADNAGLGAHVSCVDPKSSDCVQFPNIPDIQNAFVDGVISPLCSYVLDGGSAISLDGYVGAGFGPTDLSDYGIQDFSFQTIGTPVTLFTTTCTAMSATDTASVPGQLAFYSQCKSRTFPFGNVTSGNYLAGATCYDPKSTTTTTFTIELAAGGADFVTTVGARCTVSGVEGIGTSIYDFGVGREVELPSDRSNFSSLSGQILFNMGSALLAAVNADGGTLGKIGPVGAEFLTIFSGGKFDHTLMEQGVSNAMAASASAGYINSNASSGYNSIIVSAPITWTIEGFGWAPGISLAAWSAVCILIGLAWFGAALCMIGGGTTYNPTDWFQTLNTSAGSGLTQLAGTCSTAGLKTKDVNNHQLWYGELQAGHVGFSQYQVGSIRRDAKYGQAVVV